MLDKLTAKIGPLPAWAWGVILGGLILVYMWWSRSRANKAGTGTTATATATPDVTGTGLSPAPSGGGTTDTTPTWDTNATWEARALTFLAKSGTSPLTAQIALEKYLNGQTLTQAEAAIINAVLANLGSPPNGVAAIPNVTPPPPPPPPGSGETKPPAKPPAHKAPGTVVPPPKPSPPKGRSYTIQRGDTLSSISVKFYGHSNPALWQKIARANGIANVNKIYAGQTIVIPA